MDHTTPPAERLQAAANLLRERATAATPSADPYPGGWASYGTSEYGSGNGNQSTLSGGPADAGYRTGIIVFTDEHCDTCIGLSSADAQYIALMHPAVALAVASVLDVVQRSVAYVQAVDGTYPPMTAAAIAVADQILGIPAQRALAESRERNAAGIEDYDSGAGWQRVADAMDKHGAAAVLTNPGLVEDAPAAVTP